MSDEEEQDPLGPENEPESPGFSVQKDNKKKQGIKSDIDSDGSSD
jgi:hypothetical protein